MIKVECDCGGQMEMHRSGMGFSLRTIYECHKCHKEIEVREL
jgi:hypothetical protein